MVLILNMLEIHIRDLEFIKYNLKNNDSVSIEDFKDILLNINKFTNESHELLKNKKDSFRTVFLCYLNIPFLLFLDFDLILLYIKVKYKRW